MATLKENRYLNDNGLKTLLEEMKPKHLSLGETNTTAFAGDKGKIAYTHAVTNKGKSYNSGLYKITTNSEGHVIDATPVTKSDITALGVTDTTYTSLKNPYSLYVGTKTSSGGIATNQITYDGSEAKGLYFSNANASETNNIKFAVDSTGFVTGTVYDPYTFDDDYIYRNGNVVFENHQQEIATALNDLDSRVSTNIDNINILQGLVSVIQTDYMPKLVDQNPGTFGPTANVTGTNNATIKIPQIQVDDEGQITNISEYTYTSKDTNSGGTVTSITAGLGLSGGSITKSGTIKVNLKSENSLGTIDTTEKLYAVGVDSNGNLAVNVPWSAGTTGNYMNQLGSSYQSKTYGSSTQVPVIKTDASGNITEITNQTISVSNTTNYIENSYNLPLAANGTRGGIQIGYTASDMYYPVQLSNEKAYVNIPEATRDNHGTIKLAKDSSVSDGSDANDYHIRVRSPQGALNTTREQAAVQVNKDGQAWVSVPKEDSYTLPVATKDTLGGVKSVQNKSASTADSLGITSTSVTGRNYGVQLTSDDVAFVNVPWENSIPFIKFGELSYSGYQDYEQQGFIPTSTKFSILDQNNSLPIINSYSGNLIIGSNNSQYITITTDNNVIQLNPVTGSLYIEGNDKYFLLEFNNSDVSIKTQKTLFINGVQVGGTVNS